MHVSPVPSGCRGPWRSTRPTTETMRPTPIFFSFASIARARGLSLERAGVAPVGEQVDAHLVGVDVPPLAQLGTGVEVFEQAVHPRVRGDAQQVDLVPVTRGVLHRVGEGVVVVERAVLDGDANADRFLINDAGRPRGSGGRPRCCPSCPAAGRRGGSRCGSACVGTALSNASHRGGPGEFDRVELVVLGGWGCGPTRRGRSGRRAWAGGASGMVRRVGGFGSVGSR